MIHKRFTLGLLALLLWIPICPLSGQIVTFPRVVTPTSFAVVIDSLSYERCRDAVDAYRSVVEQDGLGTYLIVSNWKRPEEIRTLLQKLHETPTSPLEGCVLIGDIPVPMVRDAHHLTSAFKMDQDKYAWHRSSVPSDRYYDSFNLQFVRLKQDEKMPHLHYYSLSSNGEQQINASIYSARIRPYDREGETKYEALAKYLFKVVRERTNNGENRLDHLTTARGHGYNSESKQAWAGEQLALREQLEEVFMPSGRFKAIDFDDRYPAKSYFLTEVQQPDLDVMLFHHHGGPENQYLNGYLNGSTFDISKENIQLYARSRARKLKKGETPSQAIDRVAKDLDIPTSWISNTFDQEVIEKDSLFDRSLDVYLDDIRATKPAARLVMLDACYNGSFHLDGNVSAEYIFNEGTTLVAQANSVNVIQDKWPDEFLGLLSLGVRVGTWHQQVMYLETHLIGDPTFRFASSRLDIPRELSRDVVLRANDAGYWLSLLQSPYGDLQALALKMLKRMRYPGISELLLQAYRSSNSLVVRTEALKLLSQLNDHNFIELLKEGVHDSYELIRRKSVELIGKNGSDELVPALVESLLQDSHCKRIVFKQSGAVRLMDSNKMGAELKNAITDTPIYPDKFVSDLAEGISVAKSAREHLLSDLQPKELTKKSIKDQMFAIRSCRNAPDASVAQVLLQIALNTHANEANRIASIEALGWYNYSYKAPIIAQTLFLLSKDPSEKIAQEALKSIKRIATVR